MCHPYPGVFEMGSLDLHSQPIGNRLWRREGIPAVWLRGRLSQDSLLRFREQHNLCFLNRLVLRIKNSSADGQRQRLVFGLARKQPGGQD
jgi:hypothetical protein